MELALFNTSFLHDNLKLVEEVAHRAQSLASIPLALLLQILDVLVAVSRHENVRIFLRLNQSMLRKQLNYFIRQRNFAPVRVFDAPRPSGFTV